MNKKDKIYYCKICKKIIDYHSALYGSGKCRSCCRKGKKNSLESIEKMKNSYYHTHLKGKNNPFYDKTHSNETKNILREKALSRLCDEKYIKKFNSGRLKAIPKIKKSWTKKRRKKLSEVCKKSVIYKYWLNKRGELAANWQNGITPQHQAIRNSLENIEWRNKIFQRDNYTCQDCGDNKGGNLEAHHIKPFSIILQEFLSNYSQFLPIDDKEILIRLAKTYTPFWDLTNGKTLCNKCHKKVRSIKNVR